MSRPKLTSLSDLMPQKGEATRPEQVYEHAIKQENKHGSSHASETARLHAALHAREEAVSHANEFVVSGSNEPAPAGVNQDHPSRYRDGARSAVSFRMTEQLQDRLREYAHHARRTKQDILDQAVHEFLLRDGF